MPTDAQKQGDLIAALHLESAFNSVHFANIADESDRATDAKPAVYFADQREAVRLRERLAFVKALAVSARGLSSATSRAAANIATWRTYLPHDCVAAMIKDGWHRST
jgi:hypothetical protein